MRRKYIYSNVINTTQLINDRGYYDVETIIRNRQQAAPQFMRRLELEKKLAGHTGCVNCLEWSTDGSKLASASDDYHVIVWDPFRHKQLVKFETPHRGNIFSVKFLPKTNDATILTGAGDAKLFAFDLNRDEFTPKWRCTCHNLRVKRLATAPETPFVFWSAAEDGFVLQFDMRESHTCHGNNKIVLVNFVNHTGHYGELKCIAVNPRRPELIAIGANDSFARLYDRRMIKLDEMIHRPDPIPHFPVNVSDNLPKGCVTYFCPGHLNDHKTKWLNRAITYISFSPDGTELLANIGGEQIYLFNINNAREPEFLNLPKFGKKSRCLDPDDYNNINNNIVNGNCADVNDNTSDDLLSPERKIPKSIEKEKEQGNEYLGKEEHLLAINQYTIAIEKEPNCPILYLNRATALMRRKWYGDAYSALKDCHIALKLDPTYSKAHFRLARVLLDLKHLQEASKCLEEFKVRFPKYSSDHNVKMLKLDIHRALNPRIEVDDDFPASFMECSDNEKYWRSLAKDYEDRFVGHCNTTTDIKEANFFGNNPNYIVAGSDDGNFFIWERPTNIVTDIIRGDKTIVNCVQPHPYVCLLATSGIGQDVKLWSPQPENEELVRKYRINTSSNSSHYTDTIQKNQQRMLSDPGINGQQFVCRTS